MSTFLASQHWRYATKKFDSSKKISETNLAELKEAVRLSTSSYGLQPYTVFIIENPELRAQIQPVAWGQSQILEASHLFVFASKTSIRPEDIDKHLQNICQTRSLPEGAMNAYGDFMKAKLNTLTAEQIAVWTSKQTYLALGNLINAAADLKIDATPMEGFEPEKVNAILGLDKMGLHASLMATVGYRHEEDANQHAKKARKPLTELFVTL
jgi:nitroreductase